MHLDYSSFAVGKFGSDKIKKINLFYFLFFCNNFFGKKKSAFPEHYFHFSSIINPKQILFLQSLTDSAQFFLSRIFLLASSSFFFCFIFIEESIYPLSVSCIFWVVMHYIWKLRNLKFLTRRKDLQNNFMRKNWWQQWYEKWFNFKFWNFYGALLWAEENFFSNFCTWRMFDFD